MRAKIFAKASAFFLCAAVIAACIPATALAAWDYTYTGATKTYTNGYTYQYYNTASYLLDSVNNAELQSNMYIRNKTHPAAANTMCARGNYVIGKSGFPNPTEVTYPGTQVMNTGTYQYTYLRAFQDRSISQLLGVGDIGATGYGSGWVKSSSGTTHNITSNYLTMITMDSDGYYIPAWKINIQSIEPEIGQSNYVGEDGRVYGVAYLDDGGNVVEPDMARVELDDGSIAYVSIDDINSATFNWAETPEEVSQAVADILDLEARAFQWAFSQYYGVDALSYDAAVSCVDSMRYAGGMSDALETMENDVRVELAAGIREGCVPAERAVEVTGMSTLSQPSVVAANGVTPLELSTVTSQSINIDESAYGAIYELAKPLLRVPVPAYAEDGTTVIGQYYIDRL